MQNEIKFRSIQPDKAMVINESAILDNDLKKRKGYDVDFLNKNLQIPKINDTELQKSIAINEQPGTNGKLFLDYEHFSVQFNKEKKLPFFTAVNIIGKSNEIARIHDQRSGDVWYNDDRISINGNNFQYTNSDYKGSNLQKGHMVRFYDPAWGSTLEESKIAMGDTFHYTNCCPQVGKYNAGIWNDLEDYYMARSIFQDDKITVFTGPIFNKAKVINGLLVPLNFWKVIVYNSGKEIEAIAFLISHELAIEGLLEKVKSEEMLLEIKQVNPTLKQADIERLFDVKGLKKFMVKVELIEEKTGIDFGLKNYDYNKNKAELFYENADHINALHPVSGFENFLSKNKKPGELVAKPNRVLEIMNYNKFVNEQKTEKIDYTEFIKAI